MPACGCCAGSGAPRGLCTACGWPSQDASLCAPCAERSYHRSEYFRGIPIWDPTWTVIESASGREHGTFDTAADVALCLVIEKLARDQVEEPCDARPMADDDGRRVGGGVGFDDAIEPGLVERDLAAAHVAPGAGAADVNPAVERSHARSPRQSSALTGRAGRCDRCVPSARLCARMPDLCTGQASAVPATHLR